MGMFEDVLAWMDNKRRVAGRNVSDLMNNPRDAVPMMAERAGETLIDHFKDPMNFVGGGVGKIAYHGSPHKFDKFKTEAIGTGEGAQAYGHGLYLAESDDVAKSYVSSNGSPTNLYKTQRLFSGPDKQAALDGIEALKRNGAEFSIKDGAVTARMKESGNFVPLDWLIPIRKGPDIDSAKAVQAAKQAILEGGGVDKATHILSDGHLYKTDIPDEAVARFLDWDKPLSQQSPEVQRAMIPWAKTELSDTLAQLESRNRNFPGTVKNLDQLRSQTPEQFIKSHTDVGEDLIQRLSESGSPEDASKLLHSLGIPGIRYLDGGSRSAGQGSSNFVVFDPEMIRILERNGQATGKMPWKPGEFDIFKDTTAEAPLFRDTTR